MQKRNISFGQVGLINTSSPHPKREKPQYFKNKKEPLKDKQSVEQFMQSFFNLNHLLGNTLQHKKEAALRNNEEFPLANHLTGHCAAKKSVQGQPKFRNTTGNHKYHFVQTTNKTQQTFMDEESEYQNYLKQYQTVIKNSRSKEFVSPMAHKKEIDELITQFLSDIQQSDVKSTDLSPKSNKMAPNKTEKQQKHERSRSPTPEAIKVQKIDLTNLKANSFQSSHSKSNKKDTVKYQRQNIKRKQNSKNNKEKLNIIKIERVSPRFSDQKKQMKIQQKYQTINKMNNRQKSSEKIKIQVIKVQDLRTKNNNTDQKQKKNSQHAYNVVNIPQNIKKVVPQSTSYSNTSSNCNSNSYLQQNIYKISRTQQRKQNNEKSKVQHSEKEIKKIQENKSKKPLKIQIQISQEFDDQELKVELDSSLQKQKTQIIRMVSKKVSNMIQDTQKISINKAK